MTKQEKIQEAYGQHWETVKEFVDDNGWIRHYLGTPLIFLQYHADNKYLFDNKVENKPDMFLVFIRPKSLLGIEDNNGWIKIESEADLPKESYGKYHVFTKEPIYSDEPKSQNIEEFWGDDKNKTDWWIKNITHYQPIIKPLTPIY